MTRTRKGFRAALATALVTGLGLAGVGVTATSAAADSYDPPDPWNPGLYRQACVTWNNRAVPNQVGAGTHLLSGNDPAGFTEDDAFGILDFDTYDNPIHLTPSTPTRRGIDADFLYNELGWVSLLIPAPDNCYYVTIEVYNDSGDYGGSGYPIELSNFRFYRDGNLGDFVAGGSGGPASGFAFPSGRVLGAGESAIFNLWVGMAWTTANEAMEAAGNFGWAWDVETPPTVCPYDGLGALTSHDPACVPPPPDHSLLHIAKYIDPPSGHINDGTQLLTPIGNQPVPGVRYSAFAIPGIDLADPGDWDIVEEYANELRDDFGGSAWAWLASHTWGSKAAPPSPVVVSGVTDANGLLDLNLPINRLYFIWETATTTTPHGVYPELSNPFLVTSPRVTIAEEIEYETWVYPKNATAAIEKSIIDPADTAGCTIDSVYDVVNCPALDPLTELRGTKVGDPVTFRLVANVPEQRSGQTYLNFNITDELDPRLTLVGPAPAVEIVTDPPSSTWYAATLGTAGWTAGTEYTLAAPALGSTGNIVYTITSTGLPKLAAAVATAAGDDQQVQVVITFTAIAETQGEIPNIATYRIDSLPIPSNEIVLPYGGVSIWKYDLVAARSFTGESNLADIEDVLGFDYTLRKGYCTVSGAIASAIMTPGDCTLASGSWTRIALDQAEFMLFISDAGARAYKAGNLSHPDATPLQFYPLDTCLVFAYPLSKACLDHPDQYIPSGSPTWVTTFATDASGHLMFGGLTYGTYYALEVVAPTGYQLLNEPVAVTIEEQLDGLYFDHTPGVTLTAPQPGDPVDDVLVPNMPKNAGFPFPITGGQGALLYALLAGMIVGGTLYVLRRQKRAVIGG